MRELDHGQNGSFENIEDEEGRVISGAIIPDKGMSDGMHELYKSILESNKLRRELKQQLELIALRQIQEQSEVEEAREVAAKQARTEYRCESCGLWFLGILDFAEHDEETGHMKNRGKKVTINGHV